MGLGRDGSSHGSVPLGGPVSRKAGEQKTKQSKTKAQTNWSHNNRMFPSSSDSTYDRLSELKAKGEG